MSDSTLSAAVVVALVALTGCSSGSGVATSDSGSTTGDSRDTTDSGIGDDTTSDPDSSAVGGDPCILKSKCENDPVPTSEQVASCEMGRKRDCGAEYGSFVSCGFEKAHCTADGKTDSAATLVDCKAEYDAMMACSGTATPVDAGREGG